MVREREDGLIVGMKSISAHMGINAVTLKKLINDEGFPAVKIIGTWFSERGLISLWVRGKIEARGRQDEKNDK